MPTDQAIDINELMERIRAEAERRRIEAIRASGNVTALLPTVRTLPKPPAIGWRRTVDAKEKRLKDIVAVAREKNDGKPGTPKIFRALARKQGSYNRVLIDAIGLLANSNSQLNKQVRELTEAFDTQTRWLEILADHRRGDTGWMQALGQWMARIDATVSTIDELRSLSNRTAELENSKLQQEQERIALESELQAVRTQIDQLTNNKEETDKARVDLIASVEGLTADAENSKSVLSAQISAIQDDIARLTDKSRQAQSDFDQISAHHARLSELISRNEERQTNDAAFIKALLNSSMRDSRESNRETKVIPNPPVTTSTDFLDAFYLAFENSFRGTRHEVSERLSVYLPFLRDGNVSGERGFILDLGCGRGEWLDLLRTEGFKKSVGVDLNASMIEQCTGRGLTVLHRDALEDLRERADATCELVSAFHLVEHLPFRTLMELLAEIHRVLLPGGIVILETPNPRNILVGASDFYRDMTHRNPVHPETCSFALESIGFSRAAVYFLADHGQDRVALPQSEFRFDTLSDYVEAPRDYAVIAYKA